MAKNKKPNGKIANGLHEFLTDKAGKRKERSKVEEVAIDNIVNSTGMHELAALYLDTMTDYEVIQWATDENGNFSKKGDK